MESRLKDQTRNMFDRLAWWIMEFFLCREINNNQLLQRKKSGLLVKRYDLFINVFSVMLIYSYGCNYIRVQPLLQLTVTDCPCTVSQLWTFLGSQTLKNVLQ